MTRRIRHTRHWSSRLRAKSSFDGIQSIETVKATGAETELFRRWAGHQATVVSRGQRFGIMIAAMIQLTETITPVDTILPILEQLKPVLDQVPEVNSGQARPGVLSGDIDVDQVSFRYTQDGSMVFDRISLHIDRGELVAIVGPTGSGKSTLLRLLIGFERPDTARCATTAKICHPWTSPRCAGSSAWYSRMHDPSPEPSSRTSAVTMSSHSTMPGMLRRRQGSPRTSRRCRWACTQSSPKAHARYLVDISSV